MLCKSVSLRQYRNIEAADITFGPGITVIHGENAQGKTNLLEAVCTFALGKSFRGAADRDVILFDREYAEMKMTFADGIRDRTLRIFIPGKAGMRRVMEDNGVKIARVADMIGQFRAVLFCPEHLSLIQEGPMARRNFLDVAISQLRPVYMATLTDYNRVLKQRNALIKQAEEDRRPFDETIEFWSSQLAQKGALLCAARLDYTKRVCASVAACFADMTGGRETPELTYMGSAHLETEQYADTALVEKSLFELLMSHHDREIGAGTTLWGPHKDDIAVTLNGKEARFFASQGQQRSLSIAMKLAEGEISMEDSGEYPVFLFDDVLSELDKNRRQYLLERIAGKQVIMTTCEPLGEGISADVISVNNGLFTQVKS